MRSGAHLHESDAIQKRQPPETAESAFYLADRGAGIGEQFYPWARTIRDENALGQVRGFHLPFENGWAVSVMWGTINYCANFRINDDRFQECCPDAEVAFFFKNEIVAGIWPVESDVLGWVAADLAIGLINHTRVWPSDVDYARRHFTQVYDLLVKILTERSR